MSTRIVLEEIEAKTKKREKAEVKSANALFYIFYRISKSIGIQRFLEESFKGLEKYILGSRLQVSFPVYVATMALLPLAIAPLISAFVFVTTFYVLYMPPLLSIGLTIISFVVGYAIVFMLLYVVPVAMFSSRSPVLEKSLVVLYAYLAALGVSGASYVEALRKLWEKSESLGAEPELAEVITRIYLLGEDVVDVLKDVAERAPNREFANFLRGLANVIESGAGLDKFAEVGFESSMAIMQAKMKEAMGALEIMSEMYVTGSSVMPILGLSFAVVLATMGPSAKMFGLTLPMKPATLPA